VWVIWWVCRCRRRRGGRFTASAKIIDWVESCLVSVSRGMPQGGVTIHPSKQFSLVTTGIAGFIYILDSSSSPKSSFMRASLQPGYYRQNQEVAFIVPQEEHVHHCDSIKEPQKLQFHPKRLLLTSRSNLFSVSKARVRFLKANVSRGATLSSSSVLSSGSERFFGLGASERVRSGCAGLCAGPTGLVLVGAGRSDAQASQQRKLGGFSNVHTGQVQGASYEVLSVRLSTSGLSAWGFPTGEASSVSRKSDGGGDDCVWGPAGLSWLGGM